MAWAYQELKVQVGANEVAVKAAYRKLVMKYHPDRGLNDDASLAKMKQINVAYSVLSGKKDQ